LIFRHRCLRKSTAGHYGEKEVNSMGNGQTKVCKKPSSSPIQAA
jgi:hypothetical protein